MPDTGATWSYATSVNNYGVVLGASRLSAADALVVHTLIWRNQGTGASPLFTGYTDVHPWSSRYTASASYPTTLTNEAKPTVGGVADFAVAAGSTLANRYGYVSKQGNEGLFIWDSRCTIAHPTDPSRMITCYESNITGIQTPTARNPSYAVGTASFDLGGGSGNIVRYAFRYRYYPTPAANIEVIDRRVLVPSLPAGMNIMGAGNISASGQITVRMTKDATGDSISALLY